MVENSQTLEQLPNSKSVKQSLSCFFDINGEMDLEKLIWTPSISAQLPETLDLLWGKPLENLVFPSLVAFWTLFDMFECSRTLCSRTLHVRWTMLEGHIFVAVLLRRKQLQKTNRKTMVVNSKTSIFDHFSATPRGAVGTAMRRGGPAGDENRWIH